MVKINGCSFLISILCWIFTLQCFSATNGKNILPCGEGMEDVRLDDPGGSMEYIKARVQIFNICYAHVAADMVDTARYLSGDRRVKLRTSPLYAATLVSQGLKQGKLRRAPKAFEWGNISKAVEKILEFGFKDFKEVDKRIFQNLMGMVDNEKTLGDVKDDKLWPFFVNLKKFYFEHRELKKSKEKAAKKVKELRKYLREVGKLEGEMSLAVPERILLSALSQKNYLHFLRELMEYYSPKTYKANLKKKWKPSSVNVNIFSKRKVKEQILSALGNGKVMPVGLDFCESLLLEGTPGRPAGSCSRHAASIIGRRNFKGKCQVLIKNSSSCEEMSSKYECLEGNKVWVGLNDVIESAFSVHFLTL